MHLFQQRLLQQERDKFIDHRFNKPLVQRLTGLAGEERDRFMARCRPSYEFCLLTGEYDFLLWVKNCFAKYMQEKNTELPGKAGF